MDLRAVVLIEGESGRRLIYAEIEQPGTFPDPRHRGCADEDGWRCSVRNLNSKEVGLVHGAGGGQEPTPPPPGVSQSDWNSLIFRLEWERKFRQEK